MAQNPIFRNHSLWRWFPHMECFTSILASMGFVATARHLAAPTFRFCFFGCRGGSRARLEVVNVSRATSSLARCGTITALNVSLAMNAPVAFTN
jgi:hypothetical protein